MKVIDLLNKIVKGEEVPNEIKIDNTHFYLGEDCRGDKWYASDGIMLFDLLNQQALNIGGALDLEVEIIEEKQDIGLLRNEYIEEFENMSGEQQQYIIKTLIELALKKM